MTIPIDKNRTPEERLRAVAQILIAEIGADGPMDAEDAAAKAVQTICSLRDLTCAGFRA